MGENTEKKKKKEKRKKVRGKRTVVINTYRAAK